MFFFPQVITLLMEYINLPRDIGNAFPCIRNTISHVHFLFVFVLDACVGEGWVDEGI